MTLALPTAPRARRAPTRLLPTLLLLLVLAPAARAQRAQADADYKEISGYRLTDAGLGKYIQASKNMLAVIRNDPKLRQQLSAEEDQASGDDNPSLAQMAAKYDRHPEIAHAITSTGMSTREFVTFTFAMFQAGMGMAVQQAGGKLPDGVRPENVAFYKSHQAELQQMADETKKMAEEMSGGDGDGAAADTSGVR